MFEWKMLIIWWLSSAWLFLIFDSYTCIAVKWRSSICLSISSKRVFSWYSTSFCLFFSCRFDILSCISSHSFKLSSVVRFKWSSWIRLLKERLCGLCIFLSNLKLFFNVKMELSSSLLCLWELSLVWTFWISVYT